MLSLEKAMKCPKCGFNSFDYLDACKKCGGLLKVKPRYKVIYQSVAQVRRQETIEDKNTRGLIEEETLKSPIPSPFMPLGYDLPSAEPPQFKEEEALESPALMTSVYKLPPEKSLQSKETEEVLSFYLAEISSRVVAFIIDFIILFGITTVAFGAGLFFTDADFDISLSIMNLLIPLYFILLFLSSSYFVFLQGFAGKTIGKMIFGIRVIRDNGESIGLWEAFIRWLGYFISGLFIFIGFVWAFFDPKSQAWHDKLAGTYVIKE